MSTSEKYISEALMKDKPKIPIGLFLRDKSVTTRKLVDEAVTEEKLADDAVTTDKIKNSNVTTLKIADKNITTEKIADQNVTTEKIADNNVTTEKIRDNAIVTDKIKDHNVTWDKLTPETQKVIEAGTGVDGNLVHDMEEWNNRIAALESDKLTSKVVIYASDVIEYVPNNSSSNITIQLQNANGIISKDANYTHKHLYYNINNNGEVDVQDDNVNVEYRYHSPAQVNIGASGTAMYKGVPITFPVVRKTIFAVLPSYIGYIEDYNNWNNTGTKLVKHSLNGQYNVVNPYDLAYLVIAIPKNGMVSNISSIIQKGTLDAVQQYDVIDKGNYTLYVCKTKHNKGTYTFAVS